ncbi:MAG: glycosyltransferase family 4 protein [Peptococcaceae bacterium]|nr:glycosyltransferase family 4 protein [Peptococcaceae bacterium]
MKYIIITYDITNMGGGQQYCRNKAEALKKKGYDVFIFSAVVGVVFIHELRQHEYGVIRELRYPAYCFTKGRVNDVLDHILQLVGVVDQSTIIESTSIAAAQWGELLARQIGCKHFLFNLQEVHSYSPTVISFLKFKLDRYELAGISSRSVKLMFKGFYDIQNSELYHFRAFCTNVISDTGSSIVDTLPIATYNIGSLGRLEKKFVYPTLLQLRGFIRSNPDKTFNILMIGGGANKIVKKIEHLFVNVENARLLITGYIYPVPRTLIGKMDVFFASAGSARVTMQEGIPTIAMGADTEKPIGILNYTTKNIFYGECEHSFTRLLQMILEEKYCLKHADLGLASKSGSTDFNFEVDRQLGFINQNRENRYYDVFSIKPESAGHKLYYFFGKMFGVKMLELVRSILHGFRLPQVRQSQPNP